ncbi:TIGR03089 family protein [Trueperella pecoris]|uniref:TIGR03089 family protein n=1 Tax=Trueperella pecoris TaxID=2733571 RepID=UPI001ABDC523|nr:TIGR03089 family protein [Trueperella pecoris]QTG75095.1 hypothetical protein J4179_07680 [Trueperella pecoris]
MTSPRDLYDTLLGRGTSPALTWYDADGRVELSGKVLANHVAKIANYLSNECDVEPGTCLVLDLPPHWKTVAWALAGFVTGAHVMDREHARGGDVVVTDDPESADADVVVALNLDSFAFAWSGPLPSGVADGSAEVMTQPDALLLAPADSADTWEDACGCEERGLACEGSLAVAKPTSRQAIALAYGVLGRGDAVVLVGDDRDLTAVAAAEHATALDVNLVC